MASPAPTVSDFKLYLDTVLQSSPYVFKKGQAVKATYRVQDTDGVSLVASTNRLLFKNASGGGYVDSGYFVKESGDTYDGVWKREFTFPSDGDYIDTHTPITTTTDGLSWTYQFYDIDSTRAQASITVTYNSEPVSTIQGISTIQGLTSITL